MWSNDRFSIMRPTMWSTLSRLGEWLVSVTARLLLEVAAAFRPRRWRDTPHYPHPASLAKSSPGWVNPRRCRRAAPIPPAHNVRSLGDGCPPATCAIRPRLVVRTPCGATPSERPAVSIHGRSLEALVLHRPPGRARLGWAVPGPGHLCPACAEAVEAGVGSLGWSSRSRAVLAHLDSAVSHAKKGRSIWCRVLTSLRSPLSYRCLTERLYISKSDRPYANHPSPHLQLAPAYLASRSSVMSQPLLHRRARLHPPRQVCRRQTQPGMIMESPPKLPHQRRPAATMPIPDQDHRRADRQRSARPLCTPCAPASQSRDRRPSARAPAVRP